jgi:hypothetical protein
MPIDQSLQLSRPRQRDTPACHARSSHDTNCCTTAIAPHEEVRRYAQVAQAGIERMCIPGVGIEPVREQPLDVVTTEPPLAAD